ncbi:MAG TPA: hypothetical protein VKW04_11180 [Planctomycetota bacterium]|nr:hypothetical protein [Planctomycetota bacterium]
MPLPPKKPQAGRPAPGKTAPKAGPPTRRGSGAASPSTRSPGPAPAPKNNTPLLIGVAVGAVALVVALVAVFMGGDEPKSDKTAKKEAKPEAARKAPPPDVSGLEATGKSRCEEGQRLIQPRLSPDPSAPKDRVRNDLENGLKLLNEGLDAYQKATALAGKKYPIEDLRRLREKAIRVFCTELEVEGTKSCEDGLKIVKASQAQIVDTNALSDDDKSKLLVELKKASELIRGGMGLFARSEGVSGHQFDTTQYQEALKVIRPKIAELK